MTGAAGQSEAGVLSDAIRAGLAGTGIPALNAGVQRLMAAYRSGEVPERPVMASSTDAAAYAAYRMPATVAATASALRQMRMSVPAWSPRSLLDFGAGTGGAAWAAADEFPAIGAMTLLEQSPDAIRLGKAIFAGATSGTLRAARWLSWRLSEADGPAALDVPATDLATAAYVLGELRPEQQARLVDMAVRAADAVVLVEPGTPAGHRRILTARAQLLAAGFLIAAPCPHQLGCPLAVPGDWCHFGARLQRSAVHRQVKGAELAYEDEKFSYIAMISAHVGEPDVRSGRVVRRPQQRKGLVMLDLCASDGTSKRELVSKSKGEAYRRARKTSWGDRWSAAERDTT